MKAIQEESDDTADELARVKSQVPKKLMKASPQSKPKAAKPSQVEILSDTPRETTDRNTRQSEPQEAMRLTFNAEAP